MIRVTSFLLLLTTTAAIAQPADRAIVNQSIEWFGITNTIKFNKTFSVIAEGQFRFASDFQPMQHQARTALDIKINDHFSVVPVGYVYTWNYLYGEQPAAFKNNEHRFWQQVMYKHNLGKIKVDHRVRIEERYIQVHSRSQDNMIVDNGYSNKQIRFRYRVMARMPINADKIDSKTYFASVYDEVFASRGDVVTFHEPDQNRIFAGLGYQLSPVFTVQGGLLYQMLIKSNGAKQENNVGLQVFANYTIDLSKH
jgi:predicted porin